MNKTDAENGQKVVFSTIEMGEMQGAICIYIDRTCCNRDKNSENEQDGEISSILRFVRPGIAKAVIVGVLWGNDREETFMQRLSSELGIHGIQLVAYRPMMSDWWTHADIHWICDTREVMAAPIEITALRAGISRLAYFPHQEEIVVHGSSTDNLTAGHFDALYEDLSIVGMGTIYYDYPPADAGAVGVACHSEAVRMHIMNVLASCHSPWMMREAR